MEILLLIVTDTPGRKLCLEYYDKTFPCAALHASLSSDHY